MFEACTFLDLLAYILSCAVPDDSDVSDSDSDDNGIYDDDDYEPPRHVYNTNKSLSLKDHMGLRNYLKTSSQLQGSGFTSFHF